ncbi:Multidrug and toxin extrusion (MATE) family efflux pump YdhE/NorM [Caballeronia sordidicola]|uniref:Multidrug and toxin extrusion (MATE) family efflux pump YdhE/NorM n=1 Tax=Caballeronia sordidicola TaxID=196367 RepID=A0A242MKU4_CABSO|nr:Multidrug and toxin extrusion (MATE) family efflux pump YdhE/NorM [Caballeronia sordidicola]
MHFPGTSGRCADRNVRIFRRHALRLR